MPEAGGTLGLMMNLLARFSAAPASLRTRLERQQHLAANANSARRKIKALRQVSRLASRLGDSAAEAHGAYRLGLIYRETGHTAKAEAALAQAEAIWSRTGDPEALGDVALARAGLGLMNGRLNTAKAFALAAQARYREAGVLAARPQLGRLLHSITQMERAR